MNWSQTEHRGNLGPNFAAFLSCKSRELVITFSYFISSVINRESASLHILLHVLLSSRQNVYHFAVALNLAKRIGKGEVNGNHCPCTPRCLLCNSTRSSWGSRKSLCRHTLPRAAFQVPKLAFEISSDIWYRDGINSICNVTAREVVFCKVVTRTCELSMSLMSRWKDKTAILRKPSGVCLFESGSLMSSLLQLWLLSAPASVAAYWDFSSDCCRKWHLALDSGCKLFLTCSNSVPRFQILGTTRWH